MAGQLGGYWKLAEVLKGMTDAEPPKAGTATVRDVDGDGTVWVVPTGSDEAVPVTGMSVASVSSGDVVTVQTNSGRLSITGNATAPAVGSTYVRETVEPVEATAKQALGDAERAAAAADEAEGEAKRAHEAADAAQQEASRANEAADAAQESADEAAGAASDAKASATRANAHANDALAQLSVVQDVAGTLSWIAEHGTYRASTDAAVVDGTVYFELVDGEYVPVAEPEGSPAENGWYVLDVTDSQTDYIMAHLAVTSAGLWVLPSGIGQASDAQHAAGYKALIAATGMSVYDGAGTAVVTYGPSTTFATDRDWTVGNQQAFIFYDASENTLRIGGANVTIGGKAPADLLTSLDVSATQTATGADITVNGITVSLSNGAQGPQGPAGKGISSITEYYALSNSTSAPSDSSFSTGVKTPTASNRYVWNYELITYTDSSTSKTAKHIAATYGETGSAGKGISSIVDYYAVNNSTTAPADSAFSTTISNPTATNRYLWNYELTTYSDTSTAKTAKRIIGVYGEKGETGETGSAGTNGVSITGVEHQYYLSTSSTSQTGGSWTVEPAAYVKGRYYWERWKVSFSSGNPTYTTATLAEEVTSAWAAIEQNDEQIALKANSSDVYTKSGVDGLISTEVTNRNAAITAKANEITSTVSQTYTTKEEFENLEIGGRNLLRWTTKPTYTGSTWKTDPKDTTAWSRWSINITVEETDAGIKGTFANNTQSTGFCVPLAYEDAAVGGEDYVLSFDYRTNLATIGTPYLLRAAGGNISYTKSIPITPSETEWQHFSYVLNFPSTAGQVTQALLFPYTNGSGGGKWIEIKDASAKLEKGNKATDWTPAPEDVETRVSSAESSIIQNAQNIELKVSKNDVINQINLSTEGVLIDADRVEINGAAVFNAIKSSTDAAYDAKGAAATAKSEAISAAANDATNKAKEAYEKIRSQGIQLVTNGNGCLGDNTNWPTLTFDGTKTNVSPGAFTHAVEYTTIMSDECFPIDASKDYLFEFDAMSIDGSARFYAFLVMCDADKNTIDAQPVMYYANTLTTLANDLNPGDTTVRLTSATNWELTTDGHQRSLIFWDYTNSFGYTYPEESYSRNYYANIYANDDAVNKSTGVITLKTPWSGPKKLAGTKVSQNHSGNIYSYAQVNKYAPTEWEHFSFVYSGLDLIKNGADNTGKFRQGTAFAKVGFLWNYGHSTANPQTQMWVTNISVKEATPDLSDAVSRTQRIWYRKSAVGAPATPGTASSNWVTKSDDGSNAWTKMHVSITTSEKYIYTCEQYEMADGTVGYTSVLLDNTITVIDGGNIISGSIAANKLDVYDATIGKISAGAIDTASITIGQSQVTGLDDALDATRPWYAECTTAAGTADKVATITPATTSFSLTNGVVIHVKFTATNSAAVANLTLNVNGTGAKPVKAVRNGAYANLGHHPQANTTYEFFYNGTYWVMQENYNADTVNRTRMQNVIKASAAITAGYIICGTASGYRNVAADVAFDLSYPLLYAGTTIAAAATGDNNFLQINGINLTNSGAVQGAAQYKTAYLKGTVSGNTFTIASSNYLTCTVPTSDDGFAYVPLGMFYNSTTNIYFNSSSQLYAYKDGAFGPVSIREASAAAKTATNYITHIDDDGITVHPKSTTQNRVAIDASGTEVFKGDVSVASYGDTARIGKANGDRVVVDAMNGITIYKSNSKRLQTTANGVDVFGSDGTTSVASFGSTARVGEASDYHTVVNTAGLWFGKATDRLFKVWAESGTSALYLGTSDLVEGDDEVIALDTEGAAASTETEIPGVLLSAPQSGVSSVYARYIDFGNANLRYGRVQADASYVYITSRPTGDARTQWRLRKSDGNVQYRTYANNAWGSWASPFWYAPSSRAANSVLAAPNGSAGAASFRALAAADLPTVPVSKGGTGKTTAADARAALGITRGNLTNDSTGCTTHTFFSGLSVAKGGVIGTDTDVFKYRFFYITLASSGWCIGYRSGSSSTAGTIRGVGAYNNASITYLYEVTIAVSTAGRLTLTVAARHKQLGSAESTPDGDEINLTGVYGIF